MKPWRVIRLRRTLNWTQQQLADSIGCYRETVARWERGLNGPRGANLKALRDLAVKAKKKQK